MVRVRKAAERGHFDFGWLNTYHTFSFGEYFDPAHMGFRTLRVINEDRVRAGAGFPTHPHRDMEIVSYVIEGALEHKDSMGNGSVIRPGEVQRMTAGTGITHSEYNPSPSEGVHFLQIWILPERRGLRPGYEQKTFPDEVKRGALRLVASRDGRDGSVTIHQDASIFASLLDAGQQLERDLPPGRHAWVQVVRGTLDVNGYMLSESDGAGIDGEPALSLTARQSAEFLLFELA